MPSIRYKRGRPTRLRSRRLPVCLLAYLLAGPAQAMELPAWEQLVFERKSFWANARGVLTVSEFTDVRGASEVDAGADTTEGNAPRYLSLEVNNYVASNSEQITLTLDADTGAVQFRWRLSRGRQSRVKIHEYRDNAIFRERREPPSGDTSISPSDWPVSTEMEVALPPEANGRHIVATHAIFLLLPTLSADPQSADDYLIHNDHNFFHLEASLSDKTVVVENTLTVNAEEIEVDRRCQVLTLRMLPLASNPESADIMLMGMSGKIRIFIDRDTGLPLRLRGDAPRFGRAELNLIEANTRIERDLASRLRPLPTP